MRSAPSAEDLDVARRIAVFRGLKPPMFDRLVASAGTLSLREHEVVFSQADPTALHAFLGRARAKMRDVFMVV
jgi:hypothetical protein